MFLALLVPKAVFLINSRRFNIREQNPVLGHGNVDLAIVNSSQRIPRLIFLKSNGWQVRLIMAEFHTGKRPVWGAYSENGDHRPM